MPEGLDLGALQAQLELNRSVLAENIMSKFSSQLSASSPSSSTTPKAVPPPRPANLGVGATPKVNAGKGGPNLSNGKAASIEDVKLRGRLLAKRKRDERTVPVDQEEQAEEEEEGRSAVVGSSSKRRGAAAVADSADKAQHGGKLRGKKAKKDPFDVKGASRQQQQQQQQAQQAARTVSVNGEEVDVRSLSKAQRKKLNKRRKLEEEQRLPQPPHTQPPPPPQEPDQQAATQPAAASPPTAPASTLTPLQSQMLSRLTGSRFRTINEQLYTSDSTTALSTFSRDPTIFDEYHKGFRSQVRSWPKNPVDLVCSALLSAAALRSKARGGPLDPACLSTHTQQPKARYGACPLVLDLGAGEGQLARTLVHSGHFKVLSFDLVTTPDGWVQQADIARLHSLPLPGHLAIPPPLRPASPSPAPGQADLALFILSLMNTNWPVALLEATRVLRPGGELLIAEVSSRFASLDAFTALVERVGYRLERTDARSSTHFVLLEFVKLDPAAAERRARGEANEGVASVEALVEMGRGVLKPCLYKRR